MITRAVATALALCLECGIAFAETPDLNINRSPKIAASGSRSRRSIFPEPVTPDACCDSTPPLQLSHDDRQKLKEMLSLNSGVSGDGGEGLLHYSKNLVLNRAFFFSLAMQLQKKGWNDFRFQPGFLYYYVSSATALFTAPEPLVGSGVFFDTSRHYPNWYRTVSFNNTLPHFAPRAMRQSTSLLRVDDYGANATKDYTSIGNANTVASTEVYRFQRHDKHGGIREATIFGAPSQKGLSISNPYHDCAHGNRSLMTLSSPVLDVLPRYTGYTFLQKPRYVAAATADLDVERLLSEMSPEVHGSHNMLVPLKCQPSTPAPPAGPLDASFFRSLYPQSRLALRLAHTLSAFLQNREIIAEELDYAGNGVTYAPYEPYPNIPSANITADPPLNDTLLEAEVLANVLADPTILASGIFFEVESFTDSDGTNTSTPKRAIQAWRGASGLVVGDLSASRNPNPALTRRIRTVWKNADVSSDLNTYAFHAGIRSTQAGGGLGGFAVDPLQYQAASLGKGYWTSPHFKCDGNVDQQVVTYAAPFFAFSVAEPGKLILGGIVTVDIAVTADNWAA